MIYIYIYNWLIKINRQKNIIHTYNWFFNYFVLLDFRSLNLSQNVF